MLKHKFYIASTLANQANAIDLCKILEEGGMECTYKWFNIGEVDQSQYPEVAHAEYKGVERANTFIMLYPCKMGSATELGAALADRSKRIYIAGTADHLNKNVATGYYPSIFIYHPHVHMRIDYTDQADHTNFIANIVLDELGL